MQRLRHGQRWIAVRPTDHILEHPMENPPIQIVGQSLPFLHVTSCQSPDKFRVTQCYAPPLWLSRASGAQRFQKVRRARIDMSNQSPNCFGCHGTSDSSVSLLLTALFFGSGGRVNSSIRAFSWALICAAFIALNLF